ncbi:MAG: peptidylprolyl isomerase [Oligoflexales bacterium]
MSTIVDGSVVEMHYTLTNEAGEVIDSSKGSQPLAYIQGNRDIVPGLEKEMAGKTVGDKFKVAVSPEEGYGRNDETLIQAVPKSQFGEEAESIKVGMQFQVGKPDGQSLVVTAIEVRDDEIVLDGNHPLAGETLHFDLEVMKVRVASKEELENGLTSNESGCCHDPDCDA